MTLPFFADLNDVLNEALLLWVAFASIDPKQTTFLPGRRYDAHTVRSETKAINDARQSDPSGLTSASMLDALFHAYVEAEYVPMDALLYNDQETQARIEQARVLAALLHHPAYTEARDSMNEGTNT